MVLADDQVYQIKVSLKGSKPLIWRQVLVPGTITFARLHQILQAVMGWENYHLHMFKIDGEIYGEPKYDLDGDLGTKDERRYHLDQLVREPGTVFEYEYDFGDSWDHCLEVEKIIHMEEYGQLPTCIAGQLSGPPEDVGGLGGYSEYMQAINNRRHPEHHEWLAWRGPFDPEKFDLEAINSRLIWLSSEPRAQKVGLNKIEQLDLIQYYFPSLTRWAQSLDDKRFSTAEKLPFRQDMVVLLTYLRDNKVTSTQAANLPLKPAKEISSQFVKPPAWEFVIGKFVDSIRSSADIWSIYLMMVLADVGDLLEGGSSRRFRLTPEGQEFLAAPAPLQVWYLLAVWWTKINWLIAYPMEGMGDRLPYKFKEMVGYHLLKHPTGKSILFEPFADRLIADTKLVWHSQYTQDNQDRLLTSIERMVIDTLFDFGMVSCEYQTRTGGIFKSKDLVAFKITRFGKPFLESLAYPGRWGDLN